jgi:hypothetical protein
VVLITKADISKIMKAFAGKDHYINENSIKEAIKNKNQFNILNIN